MSEYTTPRGFTGFTRLLDTYGATVRVQESSAAEEPCVWIFIEGGAVSGFNENNGSAHLSVQQAEEIRDALNSFIEFALNAPESYYLNDGDEE